MSDDIKTVTSGNTIYNNNYDRWLFLYRSYVGGKDYANAGYLIKYQLETDKEYKARLETTPLQNECQSVVSVFNSFLFRQDPERDFGSLENTPDLEDFLEDADFEGRSFKNFIKEASVWSQVFGHTHILVTKANIGAATRLDEITAGVRPYLSLLTPLVTLDWTWDRDPTGRYTLSYFKYVEDVNGSITTIKEWTKDLIITTVVDTEREKIQEVVTEVNGLGVIPVVTLYNNRSITRGIGVSAINDVADLQKMIYNCTSEAMESIKLDSHPSLVATPDAQIGVGAGSIINIPENLDPGLKPYVLNFTGGELDKIYLAIDKCVQAVEKITNIGTVRATESKTVSGIALETEFQLLNANLSEKADNLELAEEQIWKLFCQYQGYEYDMSIEYPGSFAIRDTDRELAQLKQMKEITTDPMLLQEIDRQIAVLLDLEDFEPSETSELQESNDVEDTSMPDTPDMVVTE